MKVEGSTVKNSVVRPVAAAGETAEITFETKKLDSVTIVNKASVFLLTWRRHLQEVQMTFLCSQGPLPWRCTKIVKRILLGRQGHRHLRRRHQAKGDTKIKVGDGTTGSGSRKSGGGKILIATSRRSSVWWKKMFRNKLYKAKKSDFIAIEFEVAPSSADQLASTSPPPGGHATTTP